MNNLTIFQNDNSDIFTAGVEGVISEMHNIKGSLSEMIRISIINLLDEDQPHLIFEHSALTYMTKDFRASYSDDLDGYEIVFSDGKTAYTQLDAVKSEILYRYENGFFDDDLSEDQIGKVDEFVAEINDI